MASAVLSDTTVKQATATQPTTTAAKLQAPPVPVLTEVAQRLVAVEKKVAALEAAAQSPPAAASNASGSGGLPIEKIFFGGDGILDDVQEVFGLKPGDIAPPINAAAPGPAAAMPEPPAAAVNATATPPIATPSAATPPAALEPTITAPHLETTMESLARSNKKGGSRKHRRQRIKISRRNIQMARRHTRRSHRKGRKGTRKSRRQNK